MSKIATDELFEVTACRLPVPSPEEQRTGVVLLRELARGEPVTIAQLAGTLSVPTDTVEAFTKDSALSPFVDVGEDGRIRGFFGLSVKPTRHQFTWL